MKDTPAFNKAPALVPARAGAVVLVVIMLMTFADVIGRTVFGKSLIGTFALVVLILLLIAFPGLATFAPELSR